jgi:hypothetical protein
MPSLIIVDNKICQQCGKEFNRGRLPSGVLENIKDYTVRKYCSHSCYSQHNTGDNHYLWKGGKRKSPDGYVRLSNANDKYEHRDIMEKYLGRELNINESVHHINGNVSDNRIENLLLMSKKEHHKLHYVSRVKNEKGMLVKNG